MKRSSILTSIGVIILIVVIVLAIVMTQNNNPPSNDQNNQSSNVVVNASSDSSAEQIPNNNNPDRAPIAMDIAASMYSQPNLQLRVGDTVIWSNQDTTTHTVTSDGNQTELNSGTLARFQSYSHKFTKPGVYKYHCSFHPNMQGTITISA